MIYLYFVVVLATISCLWYRAFKNLETQGRSWFVRNWIGAIVGCFAGAIQAFMFASDEMVWNGVAVVIAVAAVSLAFSNLRSPQK